MKSAKLSSGYEMPTLGLGTWQSKPEEVENAVTNALECGYRHIDTAFNYRNEDAIGRSLKKWCDNGGKREDLFITTKLPHYGNKASEVERFLKMSLEALGLNYIDMYLIHMPFGLVCDNTGLAPLIKEDGTYEFDLETNPVAVWKEMENQVKAGRIKSIGLSNFNEEQVMEIWGKANVKPSNLQVELHAYHQQKPLREFCKAHNIVVTAYSPLGSPGAKDYFATKYNYKPDNYPELLSHPEIEKLAKKYNKGPGQILLRHLVQENVVVIPKSTSPPRIKANYDIIDFELSSEELNILDALDGGSERRIFTFLFFKGVENHPYYPFKSELKASS